MTKPKTPSDPNSSAQLLGAAWNIVGGLLGSALLGYGLGQKIGDAVKGTLIGMLIGLAYCSYEVWKLIRQLNSK